MLELFGTLNLGTRALAAQRQGTEVAGHNLANVNNPAYARQRLVVSTSMALPSAHGSQGTGVDANAIAWWVAASRAPSRRGTLPLEISGVI